MHFEFMGVKVFAGADCRVDEVILRATDGVELARLTGLSLLPASGMAGYRVSLGENGLTVEGCNGAGRAKGGFACAAKMTKEERSARGKKGAAARWKK